MSTQRHGQTNAPGKQKRRRLFFINPAFQWRYTLTLAGTVFLATSAISSILYTVLHQQARMRTMQPFSYTTDVASIVLISALVFSAVTAGALGIWCAIATHRICGPLFVLQRYLSQLAAGELPTLRPLRRKDEFKELYAVFSRTVDSLKTARNAELALIAQARDALKKGLQGDEDARRAALDSIAANLDTLQEGIIHMLGDAAQPLAEHTPDQAESTEQDHGPTSDPASDSTSEAETETPVASTR